jgi:hypothetical protein
MNIAISYVGADRGIIFWIAGVRNNPGKSFSGCSGEKRCESWNNYRVKSISRAICWTGNRSVSNAMTGIRYISLNGSKK